MYKASVKHKMVLSAAGAPQGGMGGVPTIVSVCVCVQVLFSSHNESSDFQVQCVKFALNYDF